MKLVKYNAKARFFFSTLIIPDPNKTGSEVGCLLKAAKQFKESIDILHLGRSQDSLVAFYKSSFENEAIKKIHLCQDDLFNEFQYERSALFIKGFLQQHNYNTILMGNSCISKEILPRLATLYSTQPATDVVSIDSPSVFKRQDPNDRMSTLSIHIVKKSPSV